MTGDHEQQLEKAAQALILAFDNYANITSPLKALEVATHNAVCWADAFGAADYVKYLRGVQDELGARQGEAQADLMATDPDAPK